MRQAFYRQGRFKIVAALFCAFLAFVSILVWQLPNIVDWVSKKFVPDLGFETVEYSVSEADVEHLTVESIRVGDAGWEARVERAEARFSIGGLWKQRKAESLSVSGLNLSVDLDALLEAIPDEEPAASPFDFSWLSSLPAQRITIQDGSLWLASLPGETLSIKSGQLELTDEGKGDFKLSLALGDAAAELSGTLVANGVSTLELEAGSPDLIALLERIEPQWRERFELPDSLSLDVGEWQSAARISLTPQAELSGTARFESGPIGLDYEEGQLRVETATVTVDVTEQREVSGTIEASLAGARWEGFQVEPQALSLEYRSEDLSNAKLATKRGLAWRYDEESVKGKVDFEARLGLDQETGGLKISATARASDLEVHEYAVTPGLVSIEGDLDRLAVSFPLFALQDHPSLALAEGTGSIDLSDEETTRTRFQATLPSDAFASLVPGLETSSFALTIETSSDEETDIVKLEAKMGEAGTIARRSDSFTLTGALGLALELRSGATEAVYDGSVSLRGDGLTLEGEYATLEDASLTLDKSFEKLDFDVLSAEESSVEQVARHLASRVHGSVQLYANRIAHDQATAQWVTQTLEFEPVEGDEAASFSYSANAGVVEVGGESVQQVNVSSTVVGNLEKLEGESAITLLYKGNEGSLELWLVATDPLGDPSANGNYKLHPMRFEYSDMIGARVPSLEGTTFSGTALGEGEFELNAQNVDASGLFRFTDGSFQYPPSQLEAVGVEVTIPLESVTELRTGARPAVVTVEAVQAGDLVAGDGRFEFALRGSEAAEIETARITVFDGKVSLAPTEVSLNPLALDGRLRFDRLSLELMTRQIGFFDGSMSGSISGYLPIVYEDGMLQPGEGRLTLPPGETAVLRYNAQGLLTGGDSQASEAEKTLSDRIFNFLEIDPEQMVEDALGSLTITALDVAIFPPDSPATPIRVALAGEGSSGETKVPLNLVVNVNGSLEELYNFLIRLNSIGSASVQ